MNSASVPDTLMLTICSYVDSTGPGDQIESIDFIVKDSTELFPNYKKIDLSSYESLTGLSQPFWVEGWALHKAFCSWSIPSGHSYAHSISLNRWLSGNDLSLRVVVQENPVIGLDHHEAEAIAAISGEALIRIHPNPFNTSVEIRFDIIRACRVKLMVTSVFGREVVRLVDGWVDAGEHTAVWNGKDARGRTVASGVYIVSMVIPEGIMSIKIALLR